VSEIKGSRARWCVDINYVYKGRPHTCPVAAEPFTFSYFSNLPTNQSASSIPPPSLPVRSTQQTRSRLSSQQDVPYRSKEIHPVRLYVPTQSLYLPWLPNRAVQRPNHRGYASGEELHGSLVPKSTLAELEASTNTVQRPRGESGKMRSERSTHRKQS